ncbi:MAG: hypothetical protein C0501_01195 [Isosphaera sp.]|nr:hypothetical protein [Isosphaera sp.]
MAAGEPRPSGSGCDTPAENDTALAASEPQLTRGRAEAIIPVMRALLHVGLAWLLVLAPAFCCCNARLFAGRADASPADPPQKSCCPAPSERPAPKSCCHEAEPAPAPQPLPAPHAPACQCRADLPDATLPDTLPAVSDPEPTGERLPAAVPGPAAVPPEHLGLVGGLGPPERAGVDARSEALFARHVLRC